MLRRHSAPASFFACPAGAELLPPYALPFSALPASDLTVFLTFLPPFGGAAAATVSTLTEGMAPGAYVAANPNVDTNYTEEQVNMAGVS